MFNNGSLFPIAAAGLTAFLLGTAILFSADFAHAAGQTPGASCLCPRAAGQNATTSKFFETKILLDQNDEYAALESVQLALTEVADGSSYIWHRSHGRLSGIVKPLSSFKDTHGSVCRHAVVVLSGVEATKRTEIVACRLSTGIWQLES